LRLNAAALLAAVGLGYPDKELLDNIEHSARMPADHHMLITLIPGMPQIVADIERMETDDMLTVHCFLPFVLCVLLPQGTTGKPHEPDKRMRFTDAGAPRLPLTSPYCTVVVPINEGVWLQLPYASDCSQVEHKRLWES
jgi:hypothetical protein